MSNSKEFQIEMWEGELKNCKTRLSIRQKNLDYLQNQVAAAGPYPPRNLVNNVEAEQEYITSLKIEMANLEKKLSENAAVEVYRSWRRDYIGFESAFDFDGDCHLEEALNAVAPTGNPEFAGTIRITVEYIP